MSNEEISFILGGVGLVVALIAILPMMTTKRKWFAAISLIVGVAFIVHGFYRMTNRYQVTTETVESNVRGWMDTFKVKVQKVSVTDHPDVYFGFLITYDDGRTVSVSRSKALDHYLTIEASVRVSPDHKAELEKLTKPEREAFWEKLTIELSRSRVPAQGYWPLDLITIARLIPINKDLTELALIDRMDAVILTKYSLLIG